MVVKIGAFVGVVFEVKDGHYEVSYRNDGEGDIVYEQGGEKRGVRRGGIEEGGEKRGVKRGVRRGG